MTTNLNRIPFIPKQSYDFKPMQYFYCETETTAKAITRSSFLRLLGQQPCPRAQVYVDLDGGYAYLIPYRKDRVEEYIKLTREMESEHRQFRREQQALRTGKRQTAVSLDYEMDEEGLTFGDTIATDETPESAYLLKEHFILHHSSFSALSDSDRDILTGFMNAGYNARELARRLGNDPSGVLKHVKRAAKRLQQKIEENS